MADITYVNKDKTATLGTPARTWRDLDANEVKEVVNNHRASKVSGFVPLAELPDAAKTILNATDFNAAGIANGFIVYWDTGTGKFRTKAESNVGTNLTLSGNTDVFLFDREVDGDEVTLLIGLDEQLANLVLAAPVDASGTPTFRLLTIADIPELDTFLTTNIKDALSGAASPSISNPFATIDDIPGAASGNRITNAGVLVITSETSATLTGLTWVWEGVNKSFTGALILTAKPTSPNNRFDIITVSDAATPLVEDGTAATDPAIPAPATSGHIIAQTIYRPHTDPDIVEPTPEPGVFQTQSVAGDNGLYAPIWKQNTEINYSYDFKIGYIYWASGYANASEHRPQNGYVSVSFVTAGASKLIDPDRVIITSYDVEGQSGDFALVQTDTDEVTLFARKTGFHGTHFFDYLGQKNSTVLDESLVNNGVYATLPAATTYLSHESMDFVPSTGTTISFRRAYAYGIGTALTGNLTIATTYAKDGNMVKVIHNDSVEPTITVPGGVTKRLLSGEYATSTDNVYLFIIDKDSTGDVVAVNYTISQNLI